MAGAPRRDPNARRGRWPAILAATSGVFALTIVPSLGLLFQGGQTPSPMGALLGFIAPLLLAISAVVLALISLLRLWSRQGVVVWRGLALVGGGLGSLVVGAFVLLFNLPSRIGPPKTEPKPERDVYRATVTSLAPSENAATRQANPEIAVHLAEPIPPKTRDSAYEAISFQVTCKDCATDDDNVPGVVLIFTDTPRIRFIPDAPLPAGKTFRAFLEVRRDFLRPTYFALESQAWTFQTAEDPAEALGIPLRWIHPQMPRNGRSEIVARPGTLPPKASTSERWLIKAAVVGCGDEGAGYSIADADGGFRVEVGDPVACAVDPERTVWLGLKAPGGKKRLRFQQPFFVDENETFVVQPDRPVRIETSWGAILEVPPASLPQTSRIRLSRSSALRPPSVPAGLREAGSFSFSLEPIGEPKRSTGRNQKFWAKETLRVAIPAPRGAQPGDRALMTIPDGDRLHLIGVSGVTEIGGRLYMANFRHLQPARDNLTCDDFPTDTHRRCTIERNLREFGASSDSIFLLGDAKTWAFAAGYDPIGRKTKVGVKYESRSILYFDERCFFPWAPSYWGSCGHFIVPVRIGEQVRLRRWSPWTLPSRDTIRIPPRTVRLTREGLTIVP